jgi:hypothetical protein
MCSSVCNIQLFCWMCDVIAQCCACIASCLCGLRAESRVYLSWLRKERNGTTAVAFQRCCSRYGSAAVRQKTGVKSPGVSSLTLFKVIQLRKLLAMGGRLCISLLTFGWKTTWHVFKIMPNYSVEELKNGNNQVWIVDR